MDRGFETQGFSVIPIIIFFAIVLVAILVVGTQDWPWKLACDIGLAQCTVPTTPNEVVGTASWQTYRNDEYGFEFKYPAPLRPTEVNHEYNPGIIFSINDRRADDESDAPVHAFVGRKGGTNLRTSANTFMGKQIQDTGWTLSDFAQTWYREIVFSDLGITLVVRGQTDKEDDKLFLEQILSTFEFTKDKLYKIPELGLEFALPLSLAGLTHQTKKFTGDQAVNAVGFSNQNLEAVGCGWQELGEAPLGYLNYGGRQGGVLVARARGSDLYYIRPTVQCTASPSLQWEDLENALKSLTLGPSFGRDR